MELTTVYNLPDVHQRTHVISHIALKDGSICVSLARGSSHGVISKDEIIVTLGRPGGITKEAPISLGDDRLDPEIVKKVSGYGGWMNTISTDASGDIFFFAWRKAGIRRMNRFGEVKVVAVIDTLSISSTCVIGDIIYALDNVGDRVFKIDDGMVTVLSILAPTGATHWLGGLCLLTEDEIYCGEDLSLFAKEGDELGAERLIDNIWYMTSCGDALYVANYNTVQMIRIVRWTPDVYRRLPKHLREAIKTLYLLNTRRGTVLFLLPQDMMHELCRCTCGE